MELSEKITILGAGHQGMAMAAHLSINGVECYLWNRSHEHIKEIVGNNEIICKGILNEKVRIKRVSSHISEVLQKNIMITTPSSAHRDLAVMLAPYVDESYTVILNPGRTFGSLDFIYWLKKAGCLSLPVVAETQTIIYTCRKENENTVRVYALKNDIPISALNPKNLPQVMQALPECIRNYFVPTENYLKTSLGNVGMVLHCAPVLMNVGWIENHKTKFEYYYDGISESISNVLEKIDAERLAVASAMGCQVESLIGWLQRTYHTKGKNLYEHLQSNIYYRGIDAPQDIHHRYIEEDVPNGLVALESAGEYMGVRTPVTTTIISLANYTMNCNYREIGRNYSTLKKMEDIYNGR